MLILTFLSGSFYSIGMLPRIWQKVALFNPGGLFDQRFPWSFADVGVGISVGMTLAFPGVPHRRVVDLQDRVSAEELRVKMAVNIGHSCGTVSRSK